MIPISKPWIGEEEKQAVLEVLESGMLVQGPRTAALEAKFAELCGVKHAIAVSSGTAALYVALLANRVGPGDEVITTPFTFFASVGSILAAGAVPVFVDIREETFNINPDLIESAIGPRTKAILPVHLYGYPCDMDRISAVAVDHGLVVIEDAAQAVGAKYRGQPVGSFGTGCFSLYATKNVMSGEGGIITTNDDVVAEQSRLIRNHGMVSPYLHGILGFNYRMTDLHAAIGVAQMRHLDTFTKERRENAVFLTAHIRSAITPKVEVAYEHVWHQYTIRIPSGRDAAAQRLHEAGIGARIYYPIPVHKQPCMKGRGRITGSLAVTERVAGEVLSLPVHPSLTAQDLEQIVSGVNRLC
jgi:dTDP-4-amino-4,6-dideoxygalactose transaminase